MAFHRDVAPAEARALIAEYELTVQEHLDLLPNELMIRATTADAKLLVDVDLSILGAPPARFDEYEWQVREEYSWMPDWMFRHKRREILEAFLARPRVFNTEHFFTSYEVQARANLERSIKSLALALERGQRDDRRRRTRR